MTYFMTQKVSEEALKIQAAFDFYDVYFYGWENNPSNIYLIGKHESDSIRYQIQWKSDGIPDSIKNLNLYIDYWEKELIKPDFASDWEYFNGKTISNGKDEEAYWSSFNKKPHLIGALVRGFLCLGYDMKHFDEMWEFPSFSSHEKIEILTNLSQRLEVLKCQNFN